MANTGNTQQQINYGAQPNDGTGDPLRTAFIKTDENFDNVWLAGPVGSNVTISNNTIQVNSTNGNLILKPNGTGVIQANASIVPSIDGVRDLGTSDLAWRRLYVDTLSTTDITVDGNLEVSGNLVIDGDIVQIGNLVTDAKTIQLANTATTDAQANGSGITVGANDDVATLLYNSTNNEWRTNIGANVAGNVTANYFIGNGSLLTGISSTGNFVFANNTMSISNNAMEIAATGTGADVDIEAADAVFIEALSAEVDIRSADETFITTGSGTHVWTFDTDGSLDAPGNITANYFIGNGSLLTGITSYANANVLSLGETGWAGNIIPTTSNTYSLGNSTNQWSDLYVSNATIYMNNVPIGLTAGNVLTVDGEPVLINDSNTSITTTGNITADTFFGSGVTAAAADDIVSLNAFDAGGNTVSIQAQGNTAAAVIESYSVAGNNRWTWSFDNTGTLNFPASQASIYGGLDNDFTINTSNTGNATYTFTFSQFGDFSVPINLYVSGNVYTNDIVADAGNVTITANTQSWLFDDNGVVTLPGNSAINSLANAIRISASTDDLTGIYLVNDGDAEMYANANVSIYADSANSGQGWIFDTTGNLNLPNNGSIIVDDDGVIGPDGDDLVISWDNEELILRSVEGSVELQADNDVSITTNYGAGDFQWIFGNNNELVNITGDSAIVTEAGNLAISGGRDGLSSGNVTVRAVDVGVAVRDWTFDNAGDLTVPNYIYFKDGSFIGDEGGALPPVFRVDAPLGLGINLTTDSDISGNNYTWSFGIDGNLTAPGDISTTGNISGNTAGYAIGYRDIPQVSFTGNATIATTDSGKHYYSTQSTNYILTIANNASQGFQVGAAISIVNQGTGNITIAQGSGVSLYLAGNATSGNRTLSTFGMATIMKVATDTWFINGTGVA